jgi:zinc D-Ala-D-Ala carboxypeptidase
MRILEPQSFINRNLDVRKKHRNKTIRTVFIAVVLLLFVGPFALLEFKPSNTAKNDTLSEVSLNETSVLSLRIFSGNEFRILQDNVLYFNTKKISTSPYITGNSEVDSRIRNIAESRGYKLKVIPTVSLVLVDGFLLHNEVNKPWISLRENAAANGLNMKIVSAYRSIEEQRVLFIERLLDLGISSNEIATGTVDSEVIKLLTTTSPPGYSKHHTGYTIDLQCSGWVFENFKNSPCYAWLSANNYEQAKTFGFIPSYPADADLQGPEPEAWEYIYVGTELLYN